MQSLIRTAEQLKIKGLCEINDQTNTESDTEVIYPPHKKIRASRHFERNNSNKSRNSGEEASEKHVQKSSTVTTTLNSSQDDKQKSKSPVRENSFSSVTKINSNTQDLSNSSNKNMASLEMGMVSWDLKTMWSMRLNFQFFSANIEWKCGNGCSFNLYGLCT